MKNRGKIDFRHNHLHTTQFAWNNVMIIAPFPH